MFSKQKKAANTILVSLFPALVFLAQKQESCRERMAWFFVGRASFEVHP
jgi:hypothetical protein